MLYFITGTSSCGKSFLINYIKKLYPNFIYISADEEMLKITYNIVNVLKKNKYFLVNKKTTFYDYREKLFKKIWFKLLKKYSKNRVVIIDDFYPSVIEYYHKIKYKKKLILLGLNFNRLYKNLVSRKNSNTRIPSFIFKQVMDIYKISHKCELVFKKNDLDKFKIFLTMKPKLLSKQLKSTLKKVYKYYGLNKNKQVCVEPIVHYDLFINNYNVKKSTDILLKFIKK